MFLPSWLLTIIVIWVVGLWFCVGLFKDANNSTGFLAGAFEGLAIMVIIGVMILSSGGILMGKFLF